MGNLSSYKLQADHCLVVVSITSLDYPYALVSKLHRLCVQNYLCSGLKLSLAYVKYIYQACTHLCCVLLNISKLTENNNAYIISWSQVDIFTLGSCLYELMTLRCLPPDDISEMEYKHMLQSGKRPQFYRRVSPKSPVHEYNPERVCYFTQVASS